MHMYALSTSLLAGFFCASLNCHLNFIFHRTTFYKAQSLLMCSFCLHTNTCCTIRTCESHTSMHEWTGMGWGEMGCALWGRGWDGSQVYGDGVEMKKIHGDGAGMGLIFTIVSRSICDLRQVNRKAMTFTTDTSSVNRTPMKLKVNRFKVQQADSQSQFVTKEIHRRERY